MVHGQSSVQKQNKLPSIILDSLPESLVDPTDLDHEYAAYESKSSLFGYPKYSADIYTCNGNGVSVGGKLRGPNTPLRCDSHVNPQTTTPSKQFSFSSDRWRLNNGEAEGRYKYPWRKEFSILRKNLGLQTTSHFRRFCLSMLSEGEDQNLAASLGKNGNKSPTLRSPTLVKEMMKKMSSQPSGCLPDGSEICIEVERNGNTKSSSQNNGLKKYDFCVNQNKIFSCSNQLSPPKPPRCLHDNGHSCKKDTNLESDNLIEEVLLQERSGKKNGSVIRNNNSLELETSSSHQSYLVVVAIDFGTTYSGYAFSFTHDPESIHMMRKWEGGDPGVITQKTPTTLLITPDRDFHSFGYSARDYYHDMDSQEARKWLYFDKFKMILHTTEDLTRETKITATNGESMPALTVFAYALRYFKEHALQELADQSATRLLDEDVRWVVTVPAIWRQQAKQFMRTAAYQAGIGSPENPEQLLIALEPEAASIYCRKLKLCQLIPLQSSPIKLNNQTNNEDMKAVVAENTGVRYMVVDCGGGTVDITIHEFLDRRGTLKELHKATGGSYGSIGVDKEFLMLMDDIFGKELMEQFRRKRPAGYVDLMIAFEARKRSATPYKINPLNISLPFSFIDFHKKSKGCSVETSLRKYGDSSIKWSSQGMLRLEPEVMLRLFQHTIDALKSQITEILDLISKISYLFLVGGFAESQILQNAVRGAFSHQLKVIIPQGVSLAILRGAVLFGLDPGIVNIRRSRMTYGVGILNRFIHGYHQPDKMIIKDGVEWCTDVFDRFVVSDQSVAQGDVVVRSYAPAHSAQNKSVIHIFCSASYDVQYVTDPGVKKCGTLYLELSPASLAENKDVNREIQIRMMFGETEIKVIAIDVVTGKFVRAEIDFLSH